MQHTTRGYSLRIVHYAGHRWQISPESVRARAQIGLRSIDYEILQPAAAPLHIFANTSARRCQVRRPSRCRPEHGYGFGAASTRACVASCRRGRI
jgi:hypothetical protein